MRTGNSPVAGDENETITFQIVLTTGQVATLQAIQQQNDFLQARGLKPGEFIKLRDKAGNEAEREYMDLGYSTIGHFITSSRALVREGLVRWIKDQGPVITEKGRLALRLIEIDLDEMKDQLKDIKRLRPVRKRA